MSVANSAASRLLLRRSLAASSTRAPASRATTAASSCTRHHQFHTSAPLEGRRRSPFRNVSAQKMGLLSPEDPKPMMEMKNIISADYTEEDLKALEKQYTPEQLEALKLGEKAVSTEDMALQGRFRNDPYRFDYLEDFSRVQPVVDKRVKTGRPVDTTARFMTPDEFKDDFIEFVREYNEREGHAHDISIEDAYHIWEDMRSKMLASGEDTIPDQAELGRSIDAVLGREELPEEPEKQQNERKKKKQDEDDDPEPTGELEAFKYLMERNSMTGFDGGDTALAPDVPDKVPGVAGLYKQDMDASDEALDPEGTYQELKKKTGLPIPDILEISNYQTKILLTRWVSNQTRLGKIRSSYVLAIAGNGKGQLGMAEAKSVDSEVARAKAKMDAIADMRPVRRYENRTIYGNVDAKEGATVVRLFARPPGFGLRVSHRFFEIARAAGISDLAAKMTRSRNPMNSIKAFVHALRNQPDPEAIALGRGRKLVDARKVYYGGAVE